jgi:hypothetical protein
LEYIILISACYTCILFVNEVISQEIMKFLIHYTVHAWEQKMRVPNSDIEYNKKRLKSFNNFVMYLLAIIAILYFVY